MQRLAGVKLCVCIRWREHLCVMAAVSLPGTVTTGANDAHSSIQITVANTLSSLWSLLCVKLENSVWEFNGQKTRHRPTCFMWNTLSKRHVIYTHWEWRGGAVCICWLGKITSQLKAAIYLIKNGRD